MVNKDLSLLQLHSMDEYYAYAHANKENHQYKHLILEELLEEAKSGVVQENGMLKIGGVSYPANCATQFDLSMGGDTTDINWRESLICPITLTNNRQRAAVHFFDLLSKPSTSDMIWVSEQVTPLYRVIDQRFPNTIGSEFLGSSLASGSVNKEGTRHEDFTKLSFDDESLDHIISLDCLEHVPDYECALSEAARTLKPGGTFTATFPFDINSQENLIRAEVNEDGQIVHHLEPEYHGDPVTGKGVLCYQVFGWQVLDQLVACGFSQASIFLMWSQKYAYLGPDQVIIFAKK
ncbi:MAG: class I SAM-dependent methyltransferase [Arenicella sp.]|nr:class I SAM-dependent methyltransferase [Arenicella sp.]